MHPSTARHLITRYTLEGVGEVEVSTIDLGDSTLGIYNGYETCLFWPGESDVTNRYGSWEAAEAGHASWTGEKTAKYIAKERNR